jgi:isocitrate dehydrogenase
VGELDNRGSHFYLSLYWAEELAKQSYDAELARHFRPLFEKLSNKESQIVEELAAVQGKPVDIGGYYFADPAACKAIMRPSETFNEILKSANTA